MCWRVWGRRGVLGVDGVFGVLWGVVGCCGVLWGVVGMGCCGDGVLWVCGEAIVKAIEKAKIILG